MGIYRVTYQSMTAFYGPAFIEADDEDEARRLFAAKGSFSKREMSLIKARIASIRDVQQAAQEKEDQP